MTSSIPETLQLEIIDSVVESIENGSLVPLSRKQDENDYALSQDQETFYSITALFLSGKEQDEMVSDLSKLYPDYS